MTDPGAFALIGTEHVLVFDHVLTTTAAAASLIEVIPSEPVALSPPLRAGNQP